MAGTLRTKLTPLGQMQLSRTALGVGAVVALVGVGVLFYVQQHMPAVSQLFTRKVEEPERKAALPEALKEKAMPYPPPAPPPAIPVARAVVPTVTPVLSTPPPVAVAAPTPPAPAQPTPDFLKAFQDQQDLIAQMAREQQEKESREVQRRQAGTKEVKEKKSSSWQPWVITPTDITLKKPESQTSSAKEGTEKKALEQQGKAASLIQPATWALPKYPLKTLYRSQVLPCRTLEAIDSSLPGDVLLETTVPTFDKFGYHYEILAKGTKIVARQVGVPKFGQRRLDIGIEQLEPPTGEVIQVKSKLGDANGANGMTGKVDNHWLQLGAATVINAAVNFGLRSASGTPGAGQFYQNPAQEAARDVGQTVAGDVSSVVKEQLKVPPTITVKRYEACTVKLEENITFSRNPLVVR